MIGEKFWPLVKEMRVQYQQGMLGKKFWNEAREIQAHGKRGIVYGEVDGSYETPLGEEATCFMTMLRCPDGGKHLVAVFDGLRQTGSVISGIEGPRILQDVDFDWDSLFYYRGKGVLTLHRVMEYNHDKDWPDKGIIEDRLAQVWKNGQGVERTEAWTLPLAIKLSKMKIPDPGGRVVNDNKSEPRPSMFD